MPPRSPSIESVERGRFARWLDAFLRALCLVACIASGDDILAGPIDDAWQVAKDHYEQEHWALAAEAFAQFAESHAGDARADEARFYQGESLVQAQQLAAARAAFQRFLAAAPDHEHAAQAEFRAAEAAYLSGDRAAAEEELRRFVEHRPDEPLLAFALPYLGEIALADGEPSAAVDWFETARDRFPDGPLAGDTKLGLVRGLARLARFDAARDACLELVDGEGATAQDALLELTRLEYAAGRDEAAIAACETLARRFPDSAALPLARLAMGWSLMRLARRDEGEAVFSSLEHDERVGIEARYWLGMTQLAAEKWAEAASTLTALEDEAGDYPWALESQLRAGEAWERCGNPHAARERYDAALRRWPQGDHADQCVLGLMRLALAEEDFAAVQTWRDQFLERFADRPTRVTIERLAAQALLESGQTELAITRLEDAGELVAETETNAAARDSDPAQTTPAENTLPNFADESTALKTLLAVAYQQSGRHEDVLRLTDPSDMEGMSSGRSPELLLMRSDALLALARQRAASTTDHESAGAYFEQFLAEFPVHPDRETALYDLAWWLRDVGRDEESLARLAQLRREHPTGQLAADATYRLADNAWRRGALETADELLTELTFPPDRSPTARQAQYRAARVAIARQRWEAALALLDTLESFAPDAPTEDALTAEASFWRSEALFHQHRFSEALEGFEHAAPKMAQLGEPYESLTTLRCAQCLAQGRRFADALERISPLAKRDASFEPGHELDLLLGRCHAALAEFEAARQAYRRVLDSPAVVGTPAPAQAQLLLAETYFHQQRFDEALPEYLAVEPRGGDPALLAAAWFQAGKCHEQLGDIAAATRLYQQVAERFSATEFASQAAERLRRLAAIPTTPRGARK